MVTIADVKVDGRSVSGFTKQTINLKAYQEGNTKLLAVAQQLDAKSYSSLTLVLDLDHDADGNAPGCFVRTTDNTRYKLHSTTTGLMDLSINKAWSVQQNATTKFVLDFDLRKSITYSSSELRYRFVSSSNLNSAVRLIAKAKAGHIAGTYEESLVTGADEVIVYAYKKGSFNAATETTGQGADNLLFSNAVSSAKVKSSLAGHSYMLALLEAGEYELHFAKYNANDSGEMQFTSLLQSETLVNGTLSGWISLSANSTVNISTSITGLI
jgi:hypothetical protein